MFNNGGSAQSGLGMQDYREKEPRQKTEMAPREVTKLGDIDPAGELSDTSCTLRKECHLTDD